MVEITNFRQGAVLNHNHGEESENALRITIEGISRSGTPVYVNNIKAEMDGQFFTVDIDLTEKINKVCARTTTAYGTYSQELTLVWDKKSFLRCNCYIDDNSFFFTDLAKERPKSAFDHFYLKGLKNIHDKYGMKVTLNLFYHNDHFDFELKDMPDIWKSEFIDNSDWLKFSFHSYGEFPDRLYLETTREEFARDWDLVQSNIYRFAGEECYINPVVIHWGNIHPVAAQEFIARGCKCYTTAMRARVMGGPSLADRQKGGNMQSVQSRSASGADRSCNTEALTRHYGFADEYNYIKNHGVYFDAELGLFFFGACGKLGGCCCNLVPLADVPARCQSMLDGAAKVGTEILNYASHEQYTFPYYANYLPDHMQRIEEAARCLLEVGGCKPVFFNEGLMGNTAWGD